MGRRVSGRIRIIGRPFFTRRRFRHTAITQQLAKRISDRLSTSLIEAPVRVGIIHHAKKLAAGPQDAVTFIKGSLQITRVVQASDGNDEVKARIGEKIRFQDASLPRLPIQPGLRQTVVGHLDGTRGNVEAVVASTDFCNPLRNGTVSETYFQDVLGLHIFERDMNE